MSFYKNSQINISSSGQEFNSFSFARKPAEKQIFQSRSPDSFPQKKAFIATQIQPTFDLTDNGQTFRPGEHNDIKDQNVKDLLGEIDVLLNKVGQEPQENISNDYMIRTGNFAGKQQVQQEQLEENNLFTQSLNAFGRKNPFEEFPSEVHPQKQNQIILKSSLRPTSQNSKKKVTINEQEQPQIFQKQKTQQKQSDDSSEENYRKKPKKKNKYSISSSSSDDKKAKQQQISPPKSQVSVSKSQSTFKTAIEQEQELEIFCISCEEFIQQIFIENHIKQCKVKQIQDEISYLNEKLIKIHFLLTKKTRAFNEKSQNLIKASKVIQTISDQVIKENQNSQAYQKFSDDLQAIRLLIEDGNQQSNSFIILHTFLIKIQELTVRKKNFLPKQIQFSDDFFTQQQIFEAPDPNKYLSQQHPMKYNIQPQNELPQMFQKRKTRLFEVNESKPQLPKNLVLQNRSSQNLVVMGASKAQRISIQKENNIEAQRIQKENNIEYEYRSVTPVKRKPGIIFGNEVIPDERRTFIVLSSNKKDENSKSPIQKILKNNKQEVPLQVVQKQLNFQEESEGDFKKKAISVISGISGFLSKITYLTSAPPLQANTEAQKKKFFDLAVRQKNKLSQDHPAQEIVIADLYLLCCQYKVEEADWEKWILSFYLKKN